jgi:hypothetical protein
VRVDSILEKMIVSTLMVWASVEKNHRSIDKKGILGEDSLLIEGIRRPEKTISQSIKRDLEVNGLSP